MDYGMLQGAVTSLKVAADIAIGLNKINTITEVQGKAVELQQALLSAQNNALQAQGEQFKLLDQMRALEAENRSLKAWDAEQTRYRMVSPWQGATVFAILKRECSGQPPHWACPTCFDGGRRSILVDSLRAPANGRRVVGLECPVCKTYIPSDWSGGQIERKYAEDLGAS